MQHLHTYHVTPKLPAALEPWREMAFNRRWTWQPDARKLLPGLDIASRTGPPKSACPFRPRN